MKKLFSFLAALMISSSAAFAQQPVGTWSIQPKIGLNVASLTKAEGSDPRIGLAVGAELQYQVTDIFALTGGLLYSMQGAKDKVSGYTTTAKLDYINVPILANVYVMRGLAVKLGLQPGFNINSETKVSGSSSSAETDNDDAKTVDLSIPIGLSYEFNNFVIDGRYNFGVTKVYDHADNKNSVFQITVGYKFAL